MIELLEGAPDETETELSPTDDTQISTSVPVEAFPIDVLPKPLARLVREASVALPCPPDYVAVPILGVRPPSGRRVSSK
jgi:hypothetical protein